MALRRTSTAPVGALLAAGLLALSGCAAGPASAPAPPSTGPARASVPPPRPPDVAPATDWERFEATGAALRGEIRKRAEQLRSGPVGNRAVELASLRIAANAQDLIDAGSLDGALVALQRAVSMDGGNGYAYLFLAYVHHVQGHPGQAAEFAASAERFLPRQQAVRAELAGLKLSISEGAATATGP